TDQRPSPQTRTGTTPRHTTAASRCTLLVGQAFQPDSSNPHVRLESLTYVVGFSHKRTRLATQDADAWGRGPYRSRVAVLIHAVLRRAGGVSPRSAGTRVVPDSGG